MSEVVSLQIGESRFQVSPATFYKLKRGVFTIIEGGTYYVDRDGDIFKYILKYLRNKTITFPNDFNDGELLMKQAEFYGVSELKEHFENGAGKPEIVTLKIMTLEDPVHQDASMKIYNMYLPSLPDMGIDILLSCTTGTSRVDWETLVKGFQDRLNQFYIFKCSLVNFGVGTAEVKYENRRKFGQEIERNQKSSCSQFAFHVKDDNVPTTFISGFLKSGFSLVTDMSSSNVKIFGKAYKRVRELVFERIKPVN